MSNVAESNAAAIWSTWEELLLAFAVKRHGLKNWDTVAMELQSRTRNNSFLFTEGNCKDKYRNLRRRFENHRINNNRIGVTGDGCGERQELASSGDDNNNNVLESNDGDGDRGGGEEGGESFSWLEELRRIRVDELKMEVQRSDLSIESLQMKMKEMEEEKEKSLHQETKMADLDGVMKTEISENVRNNGEKATSVEVAGNSGSGEDGSRSFNESNSTENTRIRLTNQPKPVDIKSDNEIIKSVEEEDSCNDSSDSKANNERKKDGVDSAELFNSSADSRGGSHGTKETSDVQSSANEITRKNKRINKLVGNGDGGSDGGKMTDVSLSTVAPKKGHMVYGSSEPMFGVLDVIRSHKHGSVFQRRLEIQKSVKYNDMIRRHVDLETVQTRVEDGSYSSCPAKIYVDLLLLINNAIVFFPKSSTQTRIANQLRQLIMNHLKKHYPPSDHVVRPKSEPEKPDPLLEKQKSTAPIVVCKKASSALPKTSPSSNKKIEKEGHPHPQPQSKPKPKPKPSVNKSTLSNSNEEDEEKNSKATEKPVTGVRSARKSINGRLNVNNPIPAKPKPNSSEKPESSKGNEEKTVELNAMDKKKGAANFLKRIKKNEPIAESKKASGESSKTVKKDNVNKKTDDKIDAKRGGGGGSVGGGGRIGRPPKKGKEVLKGKRDRDGSEEDGSLKRSNKRSRR